MKPFALIHAVALFTLALFAAALGWWTATSRPARFAPWD